tara:strand:+ start:1207 stop:2127 length:921 start_codon:yes stop_codon:yes gene_type:complete
MATMLTYDTEGKREDLADAIYDISPTQTPFMSTIGRTKAKATYHEWQTDNLADVDPTNAQLEGADAVAPALATTEKVGNRTQISDKVVQVSTTDDVVDKAGRTTETAYQLAKASSELKRDMETILLSNQAQNAGNASTARTLQGMQAWVTTNNVPATGTTGITTFDEEDLKGAMLEAYDQGGEPSMLLVSPKNKVQVSSFAGIAEQRYQAPKSSPTTIIGTADVYLSDFGTLNVVPDRFLDDACALFVDASMASVAYLRPFKKTKLAKTGDSEKHLMNVEYTLVVKNEKAHAKVSGIAPVTPAPAE